MPSKAITMRCQRCGAEFQSSQPEHRKYCSRACKYAALREFGTNQVEKVCVGCGESFRVMASKAHKFNYCSLECHRTSNPPRETTCETCGKKRMVKATYQGTGRFCSRHCAAKSHRKERVEVVCAVCGKVDLVWPSTASGGRRCCSNSCAVTLRMIEGFEPGYIKAKVASGHRTDIEALVEAELIALNITYEFEKRISRYWIDFYLPDTAVALECDGWMHVRPYRIERDQRRDAALAARGVRVVRIADAVIRADARGAVLDALGIAA